MEIILILALVIILPGFVYLMTAEEDDDSLGQPLPSGTKESETIPPAEDEPRVERDYKGVTAKRSGWKDRIMRDFEPEAPSFGGLLFNLFGDLSTIAAVGCLVGAIILFCIVLFLYAPLVLVVTGCSGTILALVVMSRKKQNGEGFHEGLHEFFTRLSRIAFIVIVGSVTLFAVYAAILRILEGPAFDVQATIGMIVLMAGILVKIQSWSRQLVGDADASQPELIADTAVEASPPPGPRDEAPPAPASSAIVIEQRTFLGNLLKGILIGCGIVMAVTLICRMKGVEWVPAWLATDAVLGFIFAGILSRYVRSGYTIDPVARTIVHEELTPLYMRRRDISFDEIGAVSIRGAQKGWPLLYHYHYIELQIVLVFDNGLVLPVYDPVRASEFLFRILERERARARELADVLGCPLFPEYHLGDGSTKRWTGQIEGLRSKSQQPDELEAAITGTYFSSLGMGSTEPLRVIVDMTTRFESFVLALVVAFFAVTTGYALSAEWGYLAANPRILYLILLDCTSVIVTVFGLWHLLIDEYYVFDVEASSIEYHSRWGFWKTRRMICEFGDINEIRIGRCFSIFTMKHEYVAELRYGDGERLLISDKARTAGIPVFRAFALNRLVGRTGIVDPDEFELGLRMTKPAYETHAKKSRPRGLSGWVPSGLGGILPPAAEDGLPPDGIGRGRKRRKKKRK
ncbi:hypothetical protein KBA41_00990 [Candidatus Ozemobacteraceae bacterium]|nr:hypothetical protein [Candidatus Ozemobacteraceae bacterium]